MKIIYFDCFCGFDTGMLLGALADMGADMKYVSDEIRKICPSAMIAIQPVKRCSMETLLASVSSETTEETVKRDDITDFIDSLCIDKPAQSFLNRTARIFFDSKERTPLKNALVSKKEAINELLKIYSVSISLKQFNADYIICSSLKEGCGILQSDGQSRIIPSPVTAEILKNSKIPFFGTDIEDELIHPWSAAYLSAAVNEYGPVPCMDIIKIGYGAGEKEHRIPNIIRTVLGEHNDTAINEMLESTDIMSEFSDELSDFASLCNPLP